jgi:hypothetical protein
VGRLASTPFSLGEALDPRSLLSEPLIDIHHRATGDPADGSRQPLDPRRRVALMVVYEDDLIRDLHVRAVLIRDGESLAWIRKTTLELKRRWASARYSDRAPFGQRPAGPIARPRVLDRLEKRTDVSSGASGAG